MDSPLTFLATGSVDLKRVNTTLSKIISQEIDFLEQLTSFRQLLQSAEVLKNETPKTKQNVLNPKINSFKKNAFWIYCHSPAKP